MSDQAEQSLLVARTAILALKSCAPGAEGLEADGIILTPDQTSLSTAVAVERLAALPKPLECSAKVCRGALMVTCKSPAGPTRRAYEFQIRNLDVPTAPGHLNHAMEGGDDPCILVEGRGESILLSPRELRQFKREYLIWMDGFSSGLDESSADERARGIRWRLGFARATRSLPIWARCAAWLPQNWQDQLRNLYHRRARRQIRRLQQRVKRSPAVGEAQH